MTRVVVTGIGAITPLGKNVHEFWEGLKNGVSGSEMITRFDTSKFKTKFACEVKAMTLVIISTGKRPTSWTCILSLLLLQLMKQLQILESTLILLTKTGLV
jgi:3-oxoacyl-(acyl-carrier-protein) synthase